MLPQALVSLLQNSAKGSPVGEPFALEQSRYPINQTVNNTGTDAIDDNRPCNRKHLCAHAQDEAFGLEFHRRGGDGVGEARDGDQGPGSGVFGDVVEDADAREQRRDGNQGHGGCTCRCAVHGQYRSRCAVHPRHSRVHAAGNKRAAGQLRQLQELRSFLRL